MAKKKKAAKRYLVAGVVACLLLGLLAVGGVVKADDGQSVLDKIIAKAAQLIAQDVLKHKTATEALGGTGETSTRNVTGLFDLTLKDSDSSEDDVWFSRRIIKDTLNGSASSTFLSIRNTTGHDWFVQNVYLYLPGSASGTMRVAMGTSTVSGGTTSSPAFGIFAIEGTTTTLSNAFFNQSSTSSVTGVGTNVANGMDLPVVKPNDYITGVQAYQDTFNYNPDPDSAFSTASYYVIEFIEMATST